MLNHHHLFLAATLSVSIPVYADNAADKIPFGSDNQPMPSSNLASTVYPDADPFTDKVLLLIDSGALDKALEKRFDIIQERKKKMRLAEQREEKRAKEAARLKAIKDNMPGPDTNIEPFLGREDAPFSLIEYSDFGCPFCKKFHATGKAFVKKYGGYANWIYRNLPLSIHEPYSSELAIGGLCINKLGGKDLFWDYTDAAFSQSNAKSGKRFVDQFASKNGITQESLTQCMLDNSMVKLLESNVKDASKSGFTGTPSIVLRNNINGDVRFFPGAVSLERIEKSIVEMVNTYKADIRSSNSETHFSENG